MPVCRNGLSTCHTARRLGAGTIGCFAADWDAAFAYQCGYLSGYARISCWLDVTGSQALSSVGVDVGVVIAAR